MEAAAGGIFELSLRKVPATRQSHLYSERISGYFDLRSGWACPWLSPVVARSCEREHVHSRRLQSHYSQTHNPG